MDKNKLKDTKGRPLTQSLFLELGYSDYSVYTLKDDDYEYNGKVYPSLKKRFLACSDPTEYEFAITHLLGWKHWQRIVDNKVIRKHIDEWREELEVKLRSEGVRNAIAHAQDGTFQAAKWLADRGWDKRAAGRPSKEDIERENKINEKISDEFSDDIVRLFAEES
jgi:hypothetical protein